MVAYIELITVSEDIRGYSSILEQYVNHSDAIALVMEPERSDSIQCTVRLRMDVMRSAIEAKDRGKFVERVDIMKDLGVPWDIDVATYIRGNVIVLEEKERRKRKEEWEKGAERGYELTMRLGVKVNKSRALGQVLV